MLRTKEEIEFFRSTLESYIQSLKVLKDIHDAGYSVFLNSDNTVSLYRYNERILLGEIKEPLRR